ncbi:hypothetical protein [Pseudoclavibacter sp. 8L]|uniref:hypothetical protein n=1 Tax=Pseudoclavibacter sp. 8L TaxID=2653162 RepID=UPI0012EF8FFF|nr:hypothetical protein [Pseudoclavibacter sp. 8L]VXB75183.1 conserved hypothetical protein [Pseudoclavibacter sp. 8L]
MTLHMPFAPGVVRLRAAKTVDPYSEEEVGEDWKKPDRLTIPGASVLTVNTTDPADPLRKRVITTKALSMPPASDVVETDRIEFDGQVYVIDGEIQRDRSPFTGDVLEASAILRRGNG